MSDSIRQMFDSIAPTYDALNKTLSLGIDRRWRKRQIGMLGDLAGARVLDLCAGTLDLSAAIGTKFPTARIVAADFARAMLARGLAGGKLDGVRAKVDPVQADALRLPFTDNSFDAALCAFGVRNLDDTALGLAEVRRVLVPGGRFAILEFFRPLTGPRRLLHGLYNRNVLPAIGGLISGRREAYRYLAESMEGFLSRPELERAAREIGYSVEVAEDLFPAVASLVVLRKEVA